MKPPDHHSLGGRLKTERTRIGWTQGEMGRWAGIGRVSQHLYESNRRQPNARYLQLLHMLGVDVMFVLLGAEQDRVTAPPVAKPCALEGGVVEGRGWPEPQRDAAMTDLTTDQRNELINKLVEDYSESARNDAGFAAHIFRKGCQGFENMRDEELLEAHHDAFDSDFMDDEDQDGEQEGNAND